MVCHFVNTPSTHPYRSTPTGALVTIHRPDFQQVLLRHLPKRCQIHCKKRLRSYSQNPSGPIQLFFEDGTTALCDVLVGADGLKSATRACFLDEKTRWAQAEGRSRDAVEAQSSVHPLWSGTVAYRALIPAEKLRALAPHHRVLTTPTQVCF